MRNLNFIDHIWYRYLLEFNFFGRDFIRYRGKKIQTSVKKFGLSYTLNHPSIHRICLQN
jgi:hypothetical protein